MVLGLKTRGKRAKYMGELSVDTIYNILSRIPVRSLVCFLCVCKQWRSIINDPYLETIHGRQSLVGPTCIMIHLPASGEDEYSNQLCTLSFSNTVDDSSDDEELSTAIQVSKKPILEFECCKRIRASSLICSSPYLKNDIILGCCNGLLYSSSRQQDDLGRGPFNMVVIHPLRKECYELPPNDIWSSPMSSLCMEQESCGLGFDESTNTFKMVCVLLQHYICSSEFYDVNEHLCTMVHVLGTDSWRRIAQVPCYPIKGEGIFARGRLHWLVSCLNNNNELVRIRKGRVIFFDVTKEEFGLIDAPRGQASCLNWVDEHLVYLHNEVGFVYQDSVDLKIGVLVLKECCSWKMHCCFDTRPPLPHRYIKVLGLWNNAGDIVMTNAHCRNRLYIYSLKNGKCYEVSVFSEYELDEKDIRMYHCNLFQYTHGIISKSVNYTFNEEFDE